MVEAAVIKKIRKNKDIFKEVRLIKMILHCFKGLYYMYLAKLKVDSWPM